MSFRDRIIFNLYISTKNANFFHEIVRRFYMLIFIPLLAKIIKYKFQTIDHVLPRNSVLESKHFNSFLSDIDLTIIVNNESEINQIILFFSQLKHFLIMLDEPEIYLRSEQELFFNLKSSPHYRINKLIWNIRKINWNLEKLFHTNNQLQKIKLEKSILKSFFILTKKDKFDGELYFSDITYFKKSSESDSKTLRCYLLPFLGTNLKNSMALIMNEETFLLFDYLMPTTPLGDNKRELKLEILHFELLITKASIRIDQALAKDTTLKVKWIEFLTNKLAN